MSRIEKREWRRAAGRSQKRSAVPGLSRSLGGVALLLAVACGSGNTPDPEPSVSGARAAELGAWFVAQEPEGAESVIAAKSGHADGDPVVVTGRVSEFVPGLATFTLVDASLSPCGEDGMECQTPWDYCCVDVTERNHATANVELRKDGRVVREDVQGIRGLDHLRDVVVAGSAKLDAQGNLTVIAERIFVRS